jgi:hypothetical protein
MSNATIDTNSVVHESMNFLTEIADPLLILKESFVKENWAYIKSLANEVEENIIMGGERDRGMEGGVDSGGCC